MQTEFEKPERPYRPIRRVLWLVGLCGAFLITALGAEVLSWALNLPLLVSAFVGQGAILLVALIFLLADGDGLSGLRLTAPWKPIDALLVPGLACVNLLGSVLTSLVLLATGQQPDMDKQGIAVLLKTFGDHDLGTALLIGLALALMSGMTEELLFRGYLITRLEKLRVPAWGVILLSALLFGLVHLPGYGLLMSLSKAVWFGIPMGILFWYRRNLTTLMAAHALNNFFGFTMAVLIAKLGHLN